jgi:hypothetical protein
MGAAEQRIKQRDRERLGRVRRHQFIKDNHEKALRHLLGTHQRCGVRGNDRPCSIAQPDRLVKWAGDRLDGSIERTCMGKRFCGYAYRPCANSERRSRREQFGGEWHPGVQQRRCDSDNNANHCWRYEWCVRFSRKRGRMQELECSIRISRSIGYEYSQRRYFGNVDRR